MAYTFTCAIRGQKPTCEFEKLLAGRRGWPRELFGFVQNNTREDPIEPKTLFTIPGLEAALELVPDNLAALGQLGPGLGFFA